MSKGLFDTHTHLNDPWYQEEQIETKEIIESAKKVGVSYFCNVGFDVKSSKRALTQALKYKEVYAAVGIHPNEAHKVDIDLETEEIETLANGDKVVAIGEIGLDYFHNGKNIVTNKLNCWNYKLMLRKNTTFRLHYIFVMKKEKKMLI
jgi:TatD DNase family protein